MPIFKKAEKKISFIHIPKAAGSSIEQFFTDSGWEMDFYKPCTHPNEPAVHHLTYDDLRKLVPNLDDFPSFCIVRNPYKRMVSEWRWQRNRMRTTKINFTDFVRRVEVSLKTSRTYWDNHWRPQSDFISDKISKVIRIEKLNDGFAELCEEQDLGLIGTIPKFDRSKSGAFPKLRIENGTLQKVLEIYKDDFAAFGYPTEPPTLK
jgi:hypothetical protein